MSTARGQFVSLLKCRNLVRKSVKDVIKKEKEFAIFICSFSSCQNLFFPSFFLFFSLQLICLFFPNRVTYFRTLCRVYLATVTQWTVWCWIKIINVEFSTVTNSDVIWPFTAARGTMKAHLGLYCPICHCGMCGVEPSWVLCATAMLHDTGLGHLIASISCKSIPSW